MDNRVEVAIGMMRQLLLANMSLTTLGRSVNLSPTRLRQLFKIEVGRSPAQYLKDLRLQRAEQLLLTTFLSVKEVTHLSGMNDVSHFVRAFKKQYGVTPREFRVGIQRSPQSAKSTQKMIE
jgi:transcriptional regulator GlxA family with amidase domain